VTGVMSSRVQRRRWRHDLMIERDRSRRSASSCRFDPLQSKPGQGLVLMVCLVLMTATVG